MKKFKVYFAAKEWALVEGVDDEGEARITAETLIQDRPADWEVTEIEEIA